MKTIKIFAALIASVVLLSCSKDNDGPAAVTPVDVTVKVKLPALDAKAEAESVADDYPTQIGDKMYMYVVNMTGDVLASGAFDVDDGTKKVGSMSKTLTASSDASEVLIVANWPTDFIPANYTSRNALEQAVVSMAGLSVKVGEVITGSSDTADENKHGVRYSMLYNSGTQTFNKDVATAWTTTVTLAPVMARIEVKEAAGTLALTQAQIDAGEIPMKSYTLAGLYLKNVYSGLKMQKASISANYVSGTGTKIGGSDLSTWPVNGWAGAAFTAGSYEDGLTYAPAAGAWAYHVAPTSAAADVPAIVLHLTDVVFDNNGTDLPADVANLYVSVEKYVDGSDAPVTEFKRGFVYKINSIAFNKTKLTNTPDPEEITVTATVSVIGWKEAIIIPDLD